MKLFPLALFLLDFNLFHLLLLLFAQQKVARTAIHSVMELENKRLNAKTTGKKQDVNVTSNRK